MCSRGAKHQAALEAAHLERRERRCVIPASLLLLREPSTLHGAGPTGLRGSLLLLAGGLKALAETSRGVSSRHSAGKQRWSLSY